jgi:hypothetical protein
MEEEEDGDSFNQVDTAEAVDRAEPVVSKCETAHKSAMAVPTIKETRMAGFSYEAEVISPIKSQKSSKAVFKPLEASTQKLAPQTSSEEEEEEDD